MGKYRYIHVKYYIQYHGDDIFATFLAPGERSSCFRRQNLITVGKCILLFRAEDVTLLFAG